MHRTRRRTLRRHLWAVVTAAGVMLMIAPSRAAAQEAAVTAAHPKVSIDDLVAQWASLERPLLGVSDLTDLQRDAIELLENRYRKQFSDEAEPIRQARVALLQRGPFERQNIERALARMTELRKKQLAQLRGLLTEAQRVTYDSNLRQIAAEEAEAETKREREAAFYVP